MTCLNWVIIRKGARVPVGGCARLPLHACVSGELVDLSLFCFIVFFFFFFFYLGSPNRPTFKEERAGLQARSQGGSEGADEPPFFSDPPPPPKKKVDGVRGWQLLVPGAIAPACMLALRVHVYTARNRILKVLQCRSTSNNRHSFECPLSTSSVVFCVDWKNMRLKFTNEQSVL